MEWSLGVELLSGVLEANAGVDQSSYTQIKPVHIL